MERTFVRHACVVAAAIASVCLTSSMVRADTSYDYSAGVQPLSFASSNDTNRALDIRYATTTDMSFGEPAASPYATTNLFTTPSYYAALSLPMAPPPQTPVATPNPTVAPLQLSYLYELPPVTSTPPVSTSSSSLFLGYQAGLDASPSIGGQTGMTIGALLILPPQPPPPATTNSFIDLSDPISADAVPEPGTVFLIGLGIAGIVAYRRRG